MDNSRVNKWLTLGANVGVLIGLLLLIFELRQNHELMRAQTKHDLAMGLVTVTSMPASDGRLAGVNGRAKSGAKLTDEETAQLEFFYITLLRVWEDSFYQNQIGLYDTSEYLGIRNAWERIIVESSVMMNLWCTYRVNVSPQFRAELDRSFPQDYCSNR